MDRAIPHRSVVCTLLLALAWCCAPTHAQRLHAQDETRVPAVTAPAPAEHNAASAGQSLAGPPPLRIAAGDLLDITVLDTPELSQKTRVDNDGELQLLVGGRVHLAGLTTSQAGQSVEAQLRSAKVLLHPQVSVNVVESPTEVVTVLGEVKSPGSYPILGRQSVTDLIAAAGGLTQYASHTVTLAHQDSSAPITIDLKAPAPRPGAQGQFLLPGDRIVVGRAGTIYVLGDVGKPGGFLLEDRTPTTVLQAVALAQGMNRTAGYHGSLIHQTPQGPQQEVLDLKKILANQSLDPTLRDGDIVYVPLNAAKDWANRGINSILQMAVGVVIYGRY